MSIKWAQVILRFSIILIQNPKIQILNQMLYSSSDDNYLATFSSKWVFVHYYPDTHQVLEIYSFFNAIINDNELARYR